MGLSTAQTLDCGFHEFSLQDIPQIPKQHSCSGLLMANINLEMIVLLSRALLTT